MNNDPNKLREAVESDDKPLVIVPSGEHESSMSTKEMLMNAGLWFL